MMAVVSLTSISTRDGQDSNQISLRSDFSAQKVSLSNHFHPTKLQAYMWYDLLPATTTNSFKLNRYKIQGIESSLQMLKIIIYNKSVSREHKANIKTSYSLKSR